MLCARGCDEYVLIRGHAAGCRALCFWGRVSPRVSQSRSELIRVLRIDEAALVDGHRVDHLVLVPAVVALLALRLHLVAHQRHLVAVLPQHALHVAVLYLAHVVAREVPDAAGLEAHQPLILAHQVKAADPKRAIHLARDGHVAAADGHVAVVLEVGVARDGHHCGLAVLAVAGFVDDALHDDDPAVPGLLAALATLAEVAFAKAQQVLLTVGVLHDGGPLEALVVVAEGVVAAAGAHHRDHVRARVDFDLEDVAEDAVVIGDRLLHDEEGVGGGVVGDGLEAAVGVVVQLAGPGQQLVGARRVLLVVERQLARKLGDEVAVVEYDKVVVLAAARHDAGRLKLGQQILAPVALHGDQPLHRLLRQQLQRLLGELGAAAVLVVRGVLAHAHRLQPALRHADQRHRAQEGDHTDGEAPLRAGARGRRRALRPPRPRGRHVQPLIPRRRRPLRHHNLTSTSQARV
mmetsp:Transcript_41869/g.105025  ORF Transcript_41869/g.105025 Transcript_41869/m.105025 type:complete len:462 (+) Transcript_41869:221-1606(+)